MKSQCRSFSSEFRHEATPGDQVQQLRVECDDGTPVGKTLTAEQKCIHELAARAHRLEPEKRISSSRLSGYPLWASAQLMKQERMLDCI